jgi:hypothetical protein
MSIRNVRLNALNISFVLENPKDLTLEAGSWNAYDIVTSSKPVLQSY